MTDPIPITAVVLARNEADNMGRCLQSLQRCQEIVVVDDHSIDDTALIAKQHNARVVTHRFQSFASQRNWALEQAALTTDWALMLDADEEVTDAFLDELVRQLSQASGNTLGFRTCRKTMFCGKWLRHSDGFPVWIMRVVRVRQAWFEDAGHGEVPVPQAAGALGTIREPFIHHPFSRGLADWLDRHNRYSSLEAGLESRGEARISFTQCLSRDRALRRQALRHLARRLPCRPLLRFLYQFVCKGGFLEGRQGWMFSRLMAMYESQIVLKKWELELLRRQSHPGRSPH